MPLIPLFVQTGLNTAEKRAAAAWVVVPLMPGVTINAAKDENWRREAGWSWPTAAEVAATPPTSEVRQVFPPTFSGVLGGARGVMGPDE